MSSHWNHVVAWVLHCSHAAKAACSRPQCIAGEIFGGIPVPTGSNDTQSLLHALTAASVPEVINCLRGPWALVYWQHRTRTLWFGKDVLGQHAHWHLYACSPHFKYYCNSTSLIHIPPTMCMFLLYRRMCVCHTYSLSASSFAHLHACFDILYASRYMTYAGRRSLLVHFPESHSDSFCLSSTVANMSVELGEGAILAPPPAVAADASNAWQVCLAGQAVMAIFVHACKVVLA